MVSFKKGGVLFGGVIFLLLGMAAPVLAQGLSPAQIAQFGSMSPAEQQRLAKQYGVSVPGSSSRAEQSPQLAPTIEKPPVATSPKKDRKQEADTDLPLFGYDVFSGSPTSFTPIADLPVPSDYVVGPGDEISIQLYGKENERHLLTVGRDGFINMPKLGPIAIAGKRFQQVRDDLTLRIKKQIIGADVSIGMGELRLMQVYVLGDARRPGAYNLSSLSTVSQAIIAAGGIAETGSLRFIEVLRGDKLVQKVDLYDLLVKGERTSDIRLQSGDAVFIRPVTQRVAVSGEILRPAIYELNGRTPLVELVAVAGGLKATGFSGVVQVKRLTDSGIQVHTQNLNEKAGAAFTLQSGDEVVIQPRAASYSSAIVLSGAFVKAGRFGYVPGMRITDVIGDPKISLRDDADFSVALLVNTVKGASNPVRYVQLKEVLANPQHADNYALADGDELIVLPGTDFLRCSANDLYSDAQRVHDSQVLDRVSEQLESANERSLADGAGDIATNAISVQAEISRQQQFALLQKKKIALKREHCGLRARFKPDLDIQRGVDRALIEDTASTRLQGSAGDEALALIGEERRALLAPLLEKLRITTASGSVQAITEVRGEVKFPGVYPYASEMTLSMLIKIAGGALESATLQRGELTRVVRASGRVSLEHLQIALKDVVELHPRDRVNIFQHPDWRNDLTVKIGGEVQFPGNYSVQRGETLSQLVSRAGGLNEFAYARGAILSRQSLKEKEEKQLRRLRESLKQEVASMSLQKSTPLSGNMAVSPGEAIAVIDQLDSVEALGRLVINLSAAIDQQTSQDIMFEDGDSLFIPVSTSTVSVVGEVQYPSSHVYEQGADYKAYLAKAGGLRERADKDRIYVIRASGEVVVPRNSWFGTTVEEGDTVVVPIDAQYTDKLSLFGSVTQILYQLGIAYDVIKN